MSRRQSDRRDIGRINFPDLSVNRSGSEEQLVVGLPVDFAYRVMGSIDKDLSEGTRPSLC
jgi:hypothetical protein